MAVGRCINLDWLEVYALESFDNFPCDADYFERNGWQVVRRAYGTRVYREMFTLLNWHDEPIFEIRRNPASQVGRDGGLFPPNSCHIRLCNRTCYATSPIQLLRDFMVGNGYELVKIFRIDIALDFEKFDRGDEPDKFIARYMSGKYSKINQANIAAHGTDQWAGRVWNSLSWGKPTSMVSTKLYCKSLELEQVKEKPYIKLAWFDAGLISNPISGIKVNDDGTQYKPDIYRVEFSIKSSAKRVFVIDKDTGKKGKIVVPHTLDMYDTPEKLEAMFASLAHHYFHFKYYEEGVRKDRCKDKVLFVWSGNDQLYKIDRLASHSSKTKPGQRLINLLRNYSLLHPADEVREAVRILVEYIEKQILTDMMERGTIPQEIQAMRLLIAQRCRGVVKPDAVRQLKEIRDLLEDVPELF